MSPPFPASPFLYSSNSSNPFPNNAHSNGLEMHIYLGLGRVLHQHPVNEILRATICPGCLPEKNEERGSEREGGRKSDTEGWEKNIEQGKEKEKGREGGRGRWQSCWFLRRPWECLVEGKARVFRRIYNAVMKNLRKAFVKVVFCVPTIPNSLAWGWEPFKFFFFFLRFD